MEEQNSASPQPGLLAGTNRMLVGAGIAYVAISAGIMLYLHQKIPTLEQRQAVVEENYQKQAAELELRYKGTAEALASQVGMTEKELTARAAELQHQQSMAESRLTTQQREQMKKVNSEFRGVKTDVAATRSDVQALQAKLARSIGDLGVQSGLIARTRDELDTLKHRGDRNYYEFTLLKGKNPMPVSTVSLQLRKSDKKKSKFTLNVIADDRTIEKKDRSIYEPLQFYTGRGHLLYELVINEVEKNKISGYLATPKGAPQPVLQ